MFGEKVFGEKVFGEKMFGEKVFGKRCFGEKVFGEKVYKARHTHKCLCTVLPKYSKIQVLPGITSCRLMKYNNQQLI